MEHISIYKVKKRELSQQELQHWEGWGGEEIPGEIASFMLLMSANNDDNLFIYV